MLYFSNLLQHARRGEVATQDFLGMLCVANWFQEAASLSGERIESRKERVEPRGIARRVLPPLHSLMGDFFGVVPKKVRLALLRPSPLCPAIEPPHSRPGTRKGRGGKDLEETVGTQYIIPRVPAL
jgi:hypothetical protein